MHENLFLRMSVYWCKFLLYSIDQQLFDKIFLYTMLFVLGHSVHMQSYVRIWLLYTCTNILICSFCSTWASTAKHYICGFQLAVCGVECPIGDFQGSVQREWCTRLSSHCAHHITTVSQHLSTAAKSSVQHCSGSHTHCDTAESQQLSDHGIHYTTGWAEKKSTLHSMYISSYSELKDMCAEVSIS